jgi:hypothetical protein
MIELAKRGAEVRFRELSHEAKNLIDLFPHLRNAFNDDELPVSFVIAKGSGQLKPAKADSNGHRRRRMSAAARKAVSRRMKRYWADRRRANPGKTKKLTKPAA